ncbi:MAG: 3'-5' exonuclease [Planctomycetaceae bacterium]
MRVVAIDFETANRSRDSACAVGVAVVEDGIVGASEGMLIRPPTSHFEFSEVHGIEWRDVKSAPSFREVWPRLSGMIRGADYFAAHNAPFDRSVLEACCERNGLRLRCVPFLCTMKLARRIWRIYPTRLTEVCARLRIDLQHHDAASDARACAEIVAQAYRLGGNRGLELSL